jgi:hypothetical protein
VAVCDNDGRQGLRASFGLRSSPKPFEPDPYNNGGGIA